MQLTNERDKNALFSLPQRTIHRNQHDSASNMTPIYQAQSWKVISTNKPHKRTWKNVLIPLISFHIKKTQCHHTTAICRGTMPPNVTYIFSALSLAAVLMQFLAHLWLAKWSLHYISYKHSRFISPEYYSRMAL